MASAGAGSGEIEAEEPQYFDVVKATVSPAVSLLTSPLHLAVAVAFRVDVRKAHWQIAWIADSTRKRYVRILGRTPIMDYKKGDSSFEFQSGDIDISHLKPSQLSNVGLLVASLHGVTDTTERGTVGDDAGSAESPELGSVNFVVQVVAKDGEFMRCILNPWE